MRKLRLWVECWLKVTGVGGVILFRGCTHSQGIQGWVGGKGGAGGSGMLT